ncbi:hypothetical protein K4H96_1361 [Streptococcus sanguinis]|uniref:hypothetical protein n=1 Tax=Streptococcus sanguinis TaxID=1305 RepID=UPI001CC0E457|nr:hypothetical protein [Streptococcus sanguinis]MBZ2040952.1 hypothetical protein [Streptococcus sanguinis]MCC3169586.1 hypothetical protein [Streptococcus sanguinis]
MTETEQNNSYSWYDKLVEGATQEQEERRKKAEEGLEAIRRKSQAQYDSTQELWMKSLNKMKEEREAAGYQAAELEAKQQLEASKKAHGVKTDDEKALDDAMRKMIKELK